MDPTTFEARRRALLARHGFVGEARWLTDRHGRATYALSRGTGEVPTVLLHGGLSQAGEWFPVAGALPGRVVLADRPGCGLSDPVDYRRGDLRRAAAEWVEDTADALGSDRLDVVGHSMGGYFAMAFALANPARVAHLVLIAPPGLGRDVAWAARLGGTPILGHVLSRRTIADPEANRRELARLVAHPEALPTELLENDIAAMALPGVGRAAYTMLRAGLTLRGVRPHLLVRDEMRDLATPTLWLWGDADTFVPVGPAPELARAMPHARFRLVGDTGHMVHVERPAITTRAIAGFLAGEPLGEAPRAGQPPGAG